LPQKTFPGKGFGQWRSSRRDLDETTGEIPSVARWISLTEHELRVPSTSTPCSVNVPSRFYRRFFWLAYSTVTLFAKLRGLSTSQPRRTAM
jgi:hypothetical protein